MRCAMTDTSAIGGRRREFGSLRLPNRPVIIHGGINGDMRADFQIELTGLKTITVSDFIL